MLQSYLFLTVTSCRFLPRLAHRQGRDRGGGRHVVFHGPALPGLLALPFRFPPHRYRFLPPATLSLLLLRGGPEASRRGDLHPLQLRHGPVSAENGTETCNLTTHFPGYRACRLALGDTFPRLLCVPLPPTPLEPRLAIGSNLGLAIVNTSTSSCVKILSCRTSLFCE